jgi:carboxypeptidase family protein
MSKLKLTAFTLAVLCCFHIDLAAYPQAPQAKDNKSGSTVSGRVTLKEEPMRGVTVTLQPQQSQGMVFLPYGPGISLNAKTDASGIYRITGVPAGRYSVRAAAPAYISGEGDRGYLERGRSLNIGEDETIENIDIELRRGGVITGRITDSNGHPVVEEYVDLTKFSGNGQPQQFFMPDPEARSTDDRGIYRIYGLPEGRYLVSAGYSPDGQPRPMMGGKTYPRTFYPGATDQAQAKPVEVGEGSEVTGIDIVLDDAKKGYAISGRVVLSDTRQPIPGVQVYFSSVPTDGRNYYSWNGMGERSNAKGEFRLTGLVKGKYAVVARGEQGDEVYGEPSFCEVLESDVNGIEVRLKQGSTLSGTVVLEGTNDPKVTAKLLQQLQLYFSSRSEGFNGLGQGAVKVEPDGSFVAKGLQPGKVSVMPSFGPRGPITEFSLLRLEQNGTPQPDGITINPGENITNARVVLGYSILKIRGEVKIVNGNLPKNQRLYVSARRLADSAPGRGGQSGEVDQIGRFLIERLMPGEYELHVVPLPLSPGAPMPVDPRVAKAFSQARQRVVLSADNEQSIILTIDLSQQEGNQ